MNIATDIETNLGRFVVECIPTLFNKRSLKWGIKFSTAFKRKHKFLSKMF